MSTGTWGGRRDNSGRKPTGLKCVNITLTLHDAGQAERLRSCAQKEGLTVSQLVIKTFGLDKPETDYGSLPETLTGNTRACF